MNTFQKLLLLHMMDGGSVEQMPFVTPGNDAAETAKKELIKMIGKDKKSAEIREKLTECLDLHQKVWFNIGWSTGWTAGTGIFVKLTGLDTPEISGITKAETFNTD